MKTRRREEVGEGDDAYYWDGSWDMSSLHLEYD